MLSKRRRDEAEANWRGAVPLLTRALYRLRWFIQTNCSVPSHTPATTSCPTFSATCAKGPASHYKGHSKEDQMGHEIHQGHSQQHGNNCGHTARTHEPTHQRSELSVIKDKAANAAQRVRS